MTTKQKLRHWCWYSWFILERGSTPCGALLNGLYLHGSTPCVALFNVLHLHGLYSVQCVLFTWFIFRSKQMQLQLQLQMQLRKAIALR